MEPIISKQIRLRCPEHFEVAQASIIDDFSYFSCRVKIGQSCHVANNCSIAGGKDFQFTLGDCSGVSAGVKIWVRSDNFLSDLATLLPEGVEDLERDTIEGDVSFGRCSAIGSNAVIMPGVVAGEGVAVGAMSYVPPFRELRPWTLYAGNPAKPVWQRDRDSILKQYDAVMKVLSQ